MGKKKKVHHSKPHNDAGFLNGFRAVNMQCGLDTGVQYAMDCACMVLHDEFGYGEERLRKFGMYVNKEMLDWWKATSDDEEAGYYRQKMDDKLKAAGVLDEPFERRYKWTEKRI